MSLKIVISLIITIIDNFQNIFFRSLAITLLSFFAFCDFSCISFDYVGATILFYVLILLNPVDLLLLFFSDFFKKLIGLEALFS